MTPEEYINAYLDKGGYEDDYRPSKDILIQMLDEYSKEVNKELLEAIISFRNANSNEEMDIATMKCDEILNKHV